MQEHIHKLKKHRNILYAVVFILLVFQTVSFISLSSQISKLGGSLDAAKINFDKSIQENKEYTQDLVASTNVQFGQQLKDLSGEISTSISKQQEDFNKEISLLKSTEGDFSGVIEEVVKGVVSIGSDNSIGSGFIVESSGYIVTNAHVISNVNNAKVGLYNSKILSAKVIGRDVKRDIALLKIEDSNYHTLVLSNSGDIQVGEKVIAIGNPYGLSFTVTEGIVSAVNRRGPNGLAEYIQTDVSLNPGNSGGPLINTEGKVMGVNNFKVGSADSLGFALQSNTIRDVANALANKTIIS